MSFTALVYLLTCFPNITVMMVLEKIVSACWRPQVKHLCNSQTCQIWKWMTGPFTCIYIPLYLYLYSNSVTWNFSRYSATGNWISWRNPSEGLIKFYLISRYSCNDTCCLYNVKCNEQHTHTHPPTITLMMNCGKTPFTNFRKSLGKREKLVGEKSNFWHSTSVSLCFSLISVR